MEADVRKAQTTDSNIEIIGWEERNTGTSQSVREC